MVRVGSKLALTMVRVGSKLALTMTPNPSP
jgi:hypothetical protein